MLHAAKRAHDVGLTVWALTGPAPNPLAAMADSAIAVPAGPRPPSRRSTS